MAGVTAGDGPVHISITAGAHSDEPAGPLAAINLLKYLVTTHPGNRLLHLAQWKVCPHVNPDGAEINAKWFDKAPDIKKYALHAHRDLPGEDVEFNYPITTDDERAARPENLVVKSFLTELKDYHLHCSLHGMGFAEGAWWLIGKNWIENSEEMRKELRAVFEKWELGYHDIDRKGEKGFTRIAPGFSTTPTSVAMKDFFLKKGDPKTAELFLPSSMELVQTMSPEALVMVSEIPLFRIHNGELCDPPQSNTPFMQFREKFAEARKALPQDDGKRLEQIVREFDLRAVPWKNQIQAITEGVLAAANLVIRRKQKLNVNA